MGPRRVTMKIQDCTPRWHTLGWTLLTALALMLPGFAHAERVKDLAGVAGVRTNQGSTAPATRPARRPSPCRASSTCWPSTA